MLHSKINIKSSATHGEGKGLSLHAKHDAHISAKNTKIPGNHRFHPQSAGKTMQDYGNVHTQVIRSK